MKLSLEFLAEKFAIVQLTPGDAVPAWAESGSFLSVTKTKNEVSIVCEERFVPLGVKVEKEWRAFKVRGPLDFSLIGILANLSGVLAASGVSIFAVSTFDTDYILIKNDQLDDAVRVLRQAGHEVNF